MLDLLTRRVLRETTGAFLFYLGAYLALVAVALAGTTLREGAPLVPVLLSLPDQLALPALISIPLALVTAVVVSLGRMRQDGELIALAGAGIAPQRSLLATLPLALVASAATALLAHGMLPEASARMRSGRVDLVRQALAARVAQGQPVWQEGRLALLAYRSEDDQLRHLVAGIADETSSTL